MPIVPFREIMADAFRQRYGGGVFNSVNDRTLEAVLQAPKEARLPVIVQTSITLKLTYWRSNLAFLREAQAGKEQESTRLFNQAVKERSEEIQRFGSM